VKIAFDLDAALRNPHSGFYTFGTGLLQAMDKLDSKPEMLLFYQKRYRARAERIISRLGPWATGVCVRFKFRWLQALWCYSSFPDISFFTGDFDLFHSFHHFLPPGRRKPSILTVHDLRRYVMPELYSKSKLDKFETAVRRADHFIAVSEATRNDLSRIFGIHPDRIDVVHLGCNARSEKIDRIDRIKTRERLLSSLNIKNTDYFITISSKDPRKNIHRIIHAFNNARHRTDHRIALIIAGRLPENCSAIQTDNIFSIGEVDDIIPWLACSSGLIFTSLYEGFGLPVLEGFNASIPVITSNCSSMPEVAGDAAILVDPNDTEAITHGIVSLLSHDGLARQKVRAGREQAKKFSWKSTAEKTLRIYNKICSE